MRAPSNMSNARLVVAALVIVCGTTVSLAQTAETSASSGKEPTAKAVSPSPGAAAPAGAPESKKNTTTPSATKDAPAPGSTTAGAVAKSTESGGALGARTAIVIEAVEGSVGVRRAPGEKLVILKVGDVIEEGAELMVGVNSALRVRVGQNQLLTFDQPGKATFRRAFNDGQKDVTRVRLDSGRVGFSVDSTKARNDVKIEAPDVTLAIQGTDGAIQVADGFATRAYGEAENQGRIKLDYAGGRTVVMTRNEESDTATPDPAKKQNDLASSDTPKGGSRDKDEKRLLKRAISGSQDVELSVGNTKSPINGIDLMPIIVTPQPGGSVIPTPGNIQHIDVRNGSLYQTTPGLISSVSREGIFVEPSATMGGAAILRTLPGDTGRFIHLETSFPSPDIVRNRFSQVSYSEGSPSIILRDFTGNRSAVPTLGGLGALGSTLYGSGSLGGRDGVYRVSFADGGLTRVMDLGASLEGGLGGSTRDGTLFAVARDPGALSGGGLLGQSAIVEMDPRINYLVSVYSGSTGVLGANGGTMNPGNVDLSSIQAISGVAPTETGIVLSAVTSEAGGRTVFLRYDTGSSLARGTPTLAEVRTAPELLTHGLASEAPGAVRASAILAPPTGRIDRVSISATFAEMAYSAQAFNSGFVERAVKREILASAMDPAACSASGALGSLRNILASHIDQRAGIGESVAHFHDMLPSMHPCQDMH